MASPDLLFGGTPKAYEDYSETAAAPFFQQTDQRIEEHRHDAQKDDAHQKPIHFKQVRRHSDTM